jgi:signal transduction histidine kinase
MTVVPIVLSLTSGICLFAGGIYLLFGLSRRPRDWTHITFAVASLAIAGNALAVLAIHTADSVDAYVAAFKYAFGPTALLIHVGILWFVAYYTELKPRRFLLAMSLWFTGVIVLQVVLPYGILFAGVSDLREIALPWGEKVVLAQATPNPLRLAVDLFQLVFAAFVFYATYRQYRHGDRGRARLLALAILLFVLSVVYDSLVDTGVIESIYISEIAYMGFVVIMGLRLSSELVQTETELRQYRTKLEAMVDERTVELQQANDQLAREVGVRSQAEETLRRRVEELAVLGQITQLLATVTDLPLALNQVGEEIVHLFDARYAYVILPSAQDPQVQVLVGFERETGPVGAAPLPVSIDETPHFRQVLEQAETLTITDAQALSLAAPLRDPVAWQQIQSAVLVPLLVRGAAIGLLAIATDRDDLTFTTDQVRLAETIAGDVAGAVENVRLSEQARLAAVAEERSRLARELHDSVTQTLYSVSIVAEALPRVLERNLEDAKRNARHLRRVVLGALAEMRTLLFELRPEALEAASIDVLLDQLADALRGRARIPVELKVEGESALPSEVKICLYRVAQEAFNNIARHARATQVTATLQHLPNGVVLTITDDGIGFVPDEISAEKMGISIMAERADALGAELAVMSRPDRGTQVSFAWRSDERNSSEDEGRTADDEGLGTK